MQETIVDIILSIFPKCKNLEIKDIEELWKIMYVMGFLTPKEKFWERVWDPCCDDINLTFVDYISNLWNTSKSEIQRLIKGNGLKVNNVVPNKDLCVRNLPWIKLDNDWKYCVIKKGKNVFDFILCACCGSIFELTDEEMVKKVENLQDDITSESDEFVNLRDLLVEELERRNYYV